MSQEQIEILYKKDENSITVQPINQEENHERSRTQHSWLTGNTLKVLPCGQFCMSVIALGNGALYGLTMAELGGKKITDFLGAEGDLSRFMVHGLSAGAGLAYTMFYYKVLEALNLKVNSLTQVLFCLFAPFAASTFLAGGVGGSHLIGVIHPQVALAVGITFFVFRMMGCIDSSLKFPDRIEEMKTSWLKAWEEKDLAELTRLVITGLTSIGYSLSSTDSIYSAVEIILSWFSMNKDLSSIISYLCAGVGSLGIFPLTLYWTHRGLKQLTFGGKPKEDGTNSDPTDRYTYGGLLASLPSILGIIGATVGVQGNFFGKLGHVSDIIRITSSVIYAAAAGTPGLATLLRSTFGSNSNTDVPKSGCKWFSFYKPQEENDQVYIPQGYSNSNSNV